MTKQKHLNDAWLYWDPEQMDTFPHSSMAHPQTSERTPRETGKRAKPLQLRLFEDVVLYAAGLASAIAGIGLVILLGSFISAYSVLTETHRGAHHSIAGFSGVGQRTHAPDAGAEAAEGKGAVFGQLASNQGQLTSLQTPIAPSQGRAAQKIEP